VAIAHGYLTLSLAPVLLNQVIRVDNMKFGVNYGCGKVRFPSPVPVGADLRMGVTVADVEDVNGGVQVTYDMVFEVKDSAKPACVAQVIYRYFR
jgi:acyl dehydratase